MNILAFFDKLINCFFGPEKHVAFVVEHMLKYIVDCVHSFAAFSSGGGFAMAKGTAAHSTMGSLLYCKMA